MQSRSTGAPLKVEFTSGSTRFTVPGSLKLRSTQDIYVEIVDINGDVRALTSLDFNATLTGGGGAIVDIIRGSGRPAGGKVIVRNRIRAQQPVDFPTSRSVSPASVEEAVDLQSAIIERVDGDLTELKAGGVPGSGGALSAEQAAKLDSIETGATRDQSGREIRDELDRELGGSGWRQSGGGPGGGGIVDRDQVETVIDEEVRDFAREDVDVKVPLTRLDASGGVQGNAIVVQSDGTFGLSNVSSGGVSGLDGPAVDARVKNIVEDAAEVGNAATWPLTKLPQTTGVERYLGTDQAGTLGYHPLPSPGLSQAGVDARVNALVSDIAKEGNLTRWPLTKIPTTDTVNQYLGTDGGGVLGYHTLSAENFGGLDQDGVDERVRTLVNDIAEEGNTDRWPLSKIATTGNTGQYLGTNTLGVFGYHPLPGVGEVALDVAGATSLIQGLIADEAFDANTDRWPLDKIPTTTEDNRYLGTNDNGSFGYHPFPSNEGNFLAANELIASQSFSFESTNRIRRNFTDAESHDIIRAIQAGARTFLFSVHVQKPDQNQRSYSALITADPSISFTDERNRDLVGAMGFNDATGYARLACNLNAERARVDWTINVEAGTRPWTASDTGIVRIYAFGRIGAGVGGGLDEDGVNLRIDEIVEGFARKNSADLIAGDDIGSGEITGRHLATDAVTTPSIQDSSVTEDKLQSNSVTETKIGFKAVTHNKLAAGAVEAENITDNSVRNAAIIDGAVTTSKLGPGAVTNEKLADDAVDNDKIADDAVATENIQDGAITAVKLGADVTLGDGAGGLTQAGVDARVRLLVDDAAEEGSVDRWPITKIAKPADPQKYLGTDADGLFGYHDLPEGGGIGGGGTPSGEPQDLINADNLVLSTEMGTASTDLRYTFTTEEAQVVINAMKAAPAAFLLSLFFKSSSRTEHTLTSIMSLDRPLTPELSDNGALGMLGNVGGTVAGNTGVAFVEVNETNSTGFFRFKLQSGHSLTDTSYTVSASLYKLETAGGGGGGGTGVVDGLTRVQVDERIEAAVRGFAKTSSTDLIGSANIGDAAITTAKIAPNAITTGLLATGAVEHADIAPGAVGEASISTNAVSSRNIADGAVGTLQIANGAVTADKIAASVQLGGDTDLNTLQSYDYIGTADSGGRQTNPTFNPSNTDLQIYIVGPQETPTKLSLPLPDRPNLNQGTADREAFFAFYGLRDYLEYMGSGTLFKLGQTIYKTTGHQSTRTGTGYTAYEYPIELVQGDGDFPLQDEPVAIEVYALPRVGSPAPADNSRFIPGSFVIRGSERGDPITGTTEPLEIVNIGTPSNMAQIIRGPSLAGKQYLRTSYEGSWSTYNIDVELNLIPVGNNNDGKVLKVVGNEAAWADEAIPDVPDEIVVGVASGSNKTDMDAISEPSIYFYEGNPDHVSPNELPPVCDEDGGALHTIPGVQQTFLGYGGTNISRNWLAASGGNPARWGHWIDITHYPQRVNRFFTTLTHSKEGWNLFGASCPSSAWKLPHREGSPWSLKDMSSFSELMVFGNPTTDPRLDESNAPDRHKGPLLRGLLKPSNGWRKGVDNADGPEYEFADIKLKLTEVYGNGINDHEGYAIRVARTRDHPQLAGVLGHRGTDRNTHEIISSDDGYILDADQTENTGYTYIELHGVRSSDFFNNYTRSSGLLAFIETASRKVNSTAVERRTNNHEFFFTNRISRANDALMNTVGLQPQNSEPFVLLNRWKVALNSSAERGLALHKNDRDLSHANRWYLLSVKRDNDTQKWVVDTSPTGDLWGFKGIRRIDIPNLVPTGNHLIGERENSNANLQSPWVQLDYDVSKATKLMFIVDHDPNDSDYHRKGIYDNFYIARHGSDWQDYGGKGYTADLHGNPSTPADDQWRVEFRRGGREVKVYTENGTSYYLRGIYILEEEPGRGG